MERGRWHTKLLNFRASEVPSVQPHSFNKLIYDKGVWIMIGSKEYQRAARRIIKTIAPEGDPILFNDVRRIYRVSASLLYKMTSKGEIPCHKFKGKGKLYFYRNQIDAMMRWKFCRNTL